MSRTRRLRQIVYDFLKINGTSEFHEVKDHVNSRIRHGTTSNQLGNILAKDTRFEKKSMAKHHSAYQSYLVTTWSLKEGCE